jgi:Nitrile hydratase beta subunit
VVKANDRGGLPGAGPVDRSEHTMADWELLIDSLSTVLNKKGLRSSHESRRAQEDLPAELYDSLAYYERWAAATESILVERQVLTRAQIDARATKLAEQWGSNDSP